MKLFALFAILILIIAAILNISLVLDTKESTDNIVEILEFSYSDPIFEMIDRLNESIIREYLEELVLEIGTRRTGSKKCEIAGNYIFEQFEKMGLQTQYHEWSSRTQNLKEVLYSKNIVATLPGKSNSNDEIILVTAHYDTVKVAPGGIDNGGGTVAVMAAAYALSQYQFNRTIKFITFSGEENGLLGSRSYINDIYKDDPDILIQFNLDGVGYATSAYHGSNIKLYSTTDAKWVCKEIKSVNENYGIDFYIKYSRVIPQGGPRVYTSDFYDFVLHGYEAVAIGGSENYEHWHTPQDTYDMVNISYLTNITKLMVATLAHIADIQTYHPQIRIIKPRRGMFYFRDNSMFNFKYDRIIVIDDIVIKLNIKPGDAPVDKVEFYLDDDLMFTDTNPPYQWKLNKNSVRKHNVKAVLYDEAGRTSEDEITFRLINFLRII